MRNAGGTGRCLDHFGGVDVIASANEYGDRRWNLTSLQ